MTSSRKYVIIAIAVFFLVVLNTMAGVVQIDRIYFDVAKNFDASRRDFYLNVSDATLSRSRSRSLSAVTSEGPRRSRS